jgi:hypothetical protein
LRRLELSAPVAASLWPVLAMALASHAADGSTSAAVAALTIRQSARDGHGVDGNGDLIRIVTLFDGRRVVDAWPNVFRPTYRRPPVSMPINTGTTLDRADDVQPDGIAVALLAPPRSTQGGVVLDLLATFDGGAAPVRIGMTPGEWCDAVVGLNGPERWYPYGAGSFGRRTIIDLQRVGCRAQLL